MHFENNHYIWPAFASCMALLIFYLFALGRRSRLMNKFVEKKLAGNISATASYPKKIVKMTAILIAAIFGALALARPQWGFDWEELKMRGIDILIAQDVSKSMMATDVKPNRLERSKFAVKDLIKKLKGDRVGLIAFAGTSFLQCPPTIDYDGFMLALDDLSPSTIPRGGTNIQAAIREALDVFKAPENKFKVLIIITDGEDLEGDALKSAQEAAAQGIKIFCVGVGSGEGDLIPVVGDYGERGYLTDRAGNVVKTSLNEGLLKEIAISTGGSYIRATQSEFGLVLLYNTSISKLEKRDLESKMRKRYHERFQYFLSIAVILLLLEAVVTERRGSL